MSRVSQVAVGLLLITVGYVLGASQSFESTRLHAQQASGTPTEETEDKIKRGVKQLMEAQSALEQENFMRPATKGLNAFAVSCGGVNALDDLEAGNGVDPETFAGLYAGMAKPDIAAQLGRDDQGRITYKNKIVRMYPVSRLKKMFATRLKYLGENQDDSASF
ncbi:hypothetical protein [Gimesia sp.]|uniref:hypothetical protein n=1 Tax=Gimesia sp. TaxID=2024833 RepID=UPI000C3C8CF8|nr:hypothetical protein [Gimesia sp.]MAX40157.1 hypothetical protein [Gimesia sp.]HAH46600.1 hypothetical protein [Planctomycetaceae bacterium]HBL46857.1 hypothetical protein [Planctomycetaceae bacterium]|tara:strand:+ start:3254 stop:3742 length:489 start_codon:yes stop_codon:yes gene_type:complete